jgi:hypothetical protein
MTVSRTERAERVDRLLAGITALRGVTTAAVVDQDGFVIHIRRDFEIDTDALGAAVQIMHGSGQRAAQNVGQGETNMILCENQDGLVLLAPFAGGFILAVVADRTAMLGAVRYEVKETVLELSRLF